MVELDEETLDRVARWCAEAGRGATEAEIRAALEPLGWDELLVVRALVADPPPARPLGPQALADLARGVAPDAAAERERAGLYERPLAPGQAQGPVPTSVPVSAPALSRPRRRSAPVHAPAAVLIRRARDRVATAPPEPTPLPELGELRAPTGRATLEGLLRRHGARRPPIVAELATMWRRHDGAAPDEADLAVLLEHHGLTHSFERRERDELLHALRAARGVRSRAAARAGLSPEEFVAALERLGGALEAERIREQRRVELRARATLSERVRLLLEDAEQLADLGLLEPFEADLRARLPEHVRALRTGTDPVRTALGRSLALPPSAVEALAVRCGLDLGPETPPPFSSPPGKHRERRGMDRRPSRGTAPAPARRDSGARTARDGVPRAGMVGTRAQASRPAYRPGAERRPANRSGTDRRPANRPGMDRRPANRPGMDRRPPSRPGPAARPAGPPRARPTPRGAGKGPRRGR